MLTNSRKGRNIYPDLPGYFHINLTINNGRPAATTLLILAGSSNADVERLPRIADVSWIAFDILKKTRPSTEDGTRGGI